MSEYEKDILINELQKLVVEKARENAMQKFEINDLKAEVERLENLLTPKCDKEENKN